MSDRDSKVLWKVERLFPDFDPEAVMEVLEQYGLASCESGLMRIQLAILKAFEEGAGEDEDSEDVLERLKWLVKAARVDYRDVLAWAKYPVKSKNGVQV